LHELGHTLDLVEEIARGGSAATKPVGSAWAKASVAASSKVTYA
jgi:hypothetical protein